jgi:hypothetical protein
VGNAVSCTGLALIGIAVLCLSPGLTYPGWWGALPVVGTVLMIAAGPGAFLNTRLLSRRVMVGIGVISYPLYLWHWPLLSFRAILEPDADSAIIRAILVLASVVLAILSYRLVECPLRRNTARWVTPSLVATMMGVALVGLLSATQVIHARFAKSHFDLMVHRATGDWRFPDKMKIATAGEVAYVTAGGQGRMTLFWGDSHAAQYGPRIYQLVKDNPRDGRGVMFFTKGGTPPLPGVVMDADGLWCDGNERKFRQLADEARVDTIVLAARWNMYFERSSGFSFVQDGHAFSLGTVEGRERAFTALGDLLAELKRKGKTIYLVQDNPSAPQLDPTYVYHRGILDGGFSMRAEGVSADVIREHYGPTRDGLARVAAKLGVQIIDPLPVLVKDGRFPSLSDQGEPIYKDENHFRATSVRTFIRYLDVTVQDVPR